MRAAGAQCGATFADRVSRVDLLVCTVGEPHRGQIVVFHARCARPSCGEGGAYVKRLIGLPGETVREDASAYIWVDGRRLAEPYMSGNRPRRRHGIPRHELARPE